MIGSGTTGATRHDVPEGEFDAMNDPFQSAEYERFVQSMVPHCHCSEHHRPCDGVLAGGLCDGLKDEREEGDPFERDPDSERDEEDF